MNKEKTDKVKRVIKDIIIGYGGTKTDATNEIINFLYEHYLNIEKKLKDLNEKEIFEKLKESKNYDIYYTITYFNNIIIPKFKEWK